jgi:hypothetical protein
MFSTRREGLYITSFLGPIMTWSRAGCKRDCRAEPLATGPPRGYSDGDDGTLRGPNPKCPVPVEDVERHFRGVWEPVITPENTFKPPEKDSPWFISRPKESSLNLDGSFAEWMRNEDEIRVCWKSTHNLSALGLDGIGYLRLKFGGDPMVKFLSMIFGDCVAERKVPQTWKSSRTVLLN